MPSFLTDLLQETELTARALLDWGSHLINPTLRLGVTGLSRAGKTVFITALVHDLLRGGRLPVFEALAERAHRARPPRAAARRRGAALRLRGPCRALVDRAALAGVDPADQRAARSSSTISRAQRRDAHADRSTSSTIRANGCSTCRCSTRATRNGRRRRLRLSRQGPRAPLRARRGTPSRDARSGTRPRTSRRRSRRRGSSPPISQACRDERYAHAACCRPAAS